MKTDADLKRDVTEELAWDPAIKAIALELDVKLASEHRRSDTEIAAAAEQAPRWNSLVPADKIRVTVEHGAVTLRGTVHSWAEKAAQGAAFSAPGVRAVVNELRVGV